MEGAGVRLKRAFGYPQVPLFDPFLLLDDIHSFDPADYTAGFPWHPHRGIETVTYVIAGEIDHGDSLGNAGAIGSGDVQWMTAGSGIIHQEMPQPFEGDMRGLQLWVNLPAAQKMMEPRYRDVTAATIPEIDTGDGVRLKVIAGDFHWNSQKTQGPVRDIVRPPQYLDVTLEPGAKMLHDIPDGHTALSYLLQGRARFSPDQDVVEEETVTLWGREGAVHIEAGQTGARFLLISGEPLGEPIAWRGPIVMNTREELEKAFAQYQAGTFIAGEDVRATRR